MKQKTVKIRNEELSIDGECLEESVHVWKDNGWTVVEDGDNGEEVRAAGPSPKNPGAAPQAKRNDGEE